MVATVIEAADGIQEECKERERERGWGEGVFFFSFPRSFASLTIERQTDRQTDTDAK